MFFNHVDNSSCYFFHLLILLWGKCLLIIFVKVFLCFHGINFTSQKFNNCPQEVAFFTSLTPISAARMSDLWKEKFQINSINCKPSCIDRVPYFSYGNFSFVPCVLSWCCLVVLDCTTLHSIALPFNISLSVSGKLTLIFWRLLSFTLTAENRHS